MLIITRSNFPKKIYKGRSFLAYYRLKTAGVDYMKNDTQKKKKKNYYLYLKIHNGWVIEWGSVGILILY